MDTTPGLTPCDAGSSCDAGHAVAAEPLTFDEQGQLIAADGPTILLTRPCSLATLDGSWLIEISGTLTILQQLRGPLRIESTGTVLRLSGDVYLRTLLPPLPADEDESLVLSTRPNWYPTFPQREYRWYFRSTGVTYQPNGQLSLSFERQVWSTTTQKFTSSDTGRMLLSCKTSILRPSVPTMTGTAIIGGKTFAVKATKTSPFYRGCLVEVDVMKGRSFPAEAKNCAATITHTFANVYGSAGYDCTVKVDELDVAEDAQLTRAEMHALLSHRSLVSPTDAWRTWLLVASKDTEGNLGVMFDSVDHPPHREGAMAFYDVTLPNNTLIEASARGHKVGESKLAFLRTLVHECGHGFNLFHPKHDVHAPPVGTTIMNQTGDVIGFASVANPYPCNATLAFDNHSRSSLIHSPDPQVKPGWADFGFGHGSLWSGAAEPADVAGYANAAAAEGLTLTATVPAQVHRGEVVIASVELTNTGAEPRTVFAGLNLAEGVLRARIETPAATMVDALDVAHICALARPVELAAGASLLGTMQLSYLQSGFVFDQPGRYRLHVEVDAPDATTVRAAPVDIVVRSASTEPEREIERLAMDPGVGLAVALGDNQANTASRGMLEVLADDHLGTTTGAIAALTLANTLGRTYHDPTTGQLRGAEPDAANARFATVAAAIDPTEVARLVVATISPREADTPIVAFARGATRPATRRRGRTAAADADETAGDVNRILDDHLA